MIFRKQRERARSRTAIKARLKIGDYDCPAMLLNSSEGGVLAAIDNPPVRGTTVKLVVGDVVLTGQVRWRGVDCCGIALREPIDVAALLEGDSVPSAVVPQPRGLRGIGGFIRAFMGERAVLVRPF